MITLAAGTKLGRYEIRSQIGVDPLLDPLREDPRFQDMLRRVGFPPSDKIILIGESNE